MKSKTVFILLGIFIQILFMSVFAAEIVVGKAGKLRKVLLKEHLSQIDSLIIIGEINGTDILALKEMPFLKYLDLRKCRIKKGGKVYYRNKSKKLKMKTENDVFTPYLFDFSFKCLESIVLPESLQSIEKNGMFLKLKSIHVTNKNTRFLSNSSIFLGEETIFILDSYDMLSCLPGKGNEVKYMKICNGSISCRGFVNCKKLKSIVLSENVSSLDEAAFQGCISLENIDILGSVRELKKSTFESCMSLKSIRMQDGLERIGDRCFYGCSALVCVDIPNTVLKIENSSFEGCKSLSEFKFPDKLFAIGNKSFAETNLTSLKLPASLVYIGDYAWNKCPLTKIEYPRDVLDIGENDFSSIDDLSIYMKSIHKPLGNVNGFYTMLFIPDGTLKNYQDWSDQAYIIDSKNPICKTINLNEGYDLRSIYYTDTLNVLGKMDSESFDALVKNMRMNKCLNFYNAKYEISKIDIEVAYAAFLEEEEKKKKDKDLSEFLGVLAAGASLYAEYFMEPLTGTVTKVIADEVQKSMEEDVNKYKEGVFYTDTIKNYLTLSDNLSHIRGLSTICLPSNVNNLFVKTSKDWNLYIKDLPFDTMNVKCNTVRFFVPAKYEQYVNGNSDWEKLTYHIYNDVSRWKKEDNFDIEEGNRLLNN